MTAASRGGLQASDSLARNRFIPESEGLSQSCEAHGDSGDVQG